MSFYTGWNHGVCRSTGFKCMKQFVLDLGLDLDLDPNSLARGFGWKGSLFFFISCVGYMASTNKLIR